MLKDKYILVIDDEEHFTKELRKELNLKNANVKVVNNIEAALNSLSKFKPNMVILDLDMPDVDGVDAFKKIKSLCCDLDVLALSNESTKDKADEVIKLGAVDHIGKEHTLEKMCEKVIHAFENASVAVTFAEKGEYDSIKEDM